MNSPAKTLVLLILLSGFARSQNKAKFDGEQRSFDLGHRKPVVRQHVPLSDADMEALSSSKLGIPLSGRIDFDQQDPMPKLTRDGLEAAVVHLSGSGERDLVVIGSGRRYAIPRIMVDSAGEHICTECSRHAPLAPFWVIREEHGKAKVVLAIQSTGLSILPFAQHGLDALDVWGTGQPGTTYHLAFNGEKYAWDGESSD